MSDERDLPRRLLADPRVAAGRVVAERLAPAVLPLIFALASVYLVARAFSGYDLVRTLPFSPRIRLALARHDAAAPTLIALLSGLGSFAAWSRARVHGRELAQVEAERRRGLEGQIADYRRELERTRGDLRERETALGEARQTVDALESRVTEAEGAVEETKASARSEVEEERARRARVERARQAEKEWNRELREQISTLYRERGALADLSDLRALVLRIAITLLGAEKGLLLSRDDEDGDGRLDLVCAHGFDHDPAHSAVAQRFADKVLDRDETVREEDPQPAEGASVSEADREIENLVAIPIFIRDRFSGVVICANKPGGFHEHDDEVLLSVGDHAGAVLENSRLQGQVRSSYLATVRMLADAIEAKDRYLGGHSGEVSSYVAAVADRLGLEPQRREALIFGSLLHDVGKIGISERILLKPAGLTPEERDVIELHPRIGARLVEQVPALRAIAPAILHHHERFDGAGYPEHLSGDDIPLEARVICVVDSFSAMTVQRPYRGPMSLDDACAELERCAGTQFDPQIARVFVEEVRRRPPAAGGAHPLEDPALEPLRGGGELVLGTGSVAMTDGLTLLYSHRHFHDVANAEAQRAALGRRPFTVVMVELADLPEINRRSGYAAGDAAIQAAAGTVEEVAVRHHATACRFSGRRLAIVAPDADQDAGRRLADEVADRFADGARVRVAAATWEPEETGEAVIARASYVLELQPAV